LACRPPSPRRQTAPGLLLLGIPTRAPAEAVAPAFALEDVATRPSDEPVPARTAPEGVVSGTAVDLVAGGAAAEPVAEVAAGDPVAAMGKRWEKRFPIEAVLQRFRAVGGAPAIWLDCGGNRSLEPLAAASPGGFESP